MAGLEVVGADSPLVRSAISLHREERISWSDALIVRAAQVGGCSLLLSEDLDHGRAFGSVRVVDPFRG